MEVFDTNPKHWASSKRSQKYGDPKEKRKAHPNGQNVKKVAVEYYFTKNSSQFTFEKNIRKPNVDGTALHTIRNKSKLYGTTPFEESLNCHMLTSLNYSLNKNKNWEKIPSIIENTAADEKCKVLRGTEKYSFGDRECDVYKLAYFDMNDLQQKTIKLIQEQEKYNKSLNYNVDDINNYVYDRFVETIKRKEHKNSLKRWKQTQLVRPKNISKTSQYIPFKSITARSIKKGCKISNATVRSFGKKSFWSPIQNDDARDFIQLDLGKNVWIEAISSRGRCLMRHHNDYEIDYTRSYIEYVKKYKVMIKKDDGKTVSSQKYDNKNIPKNTNEEFISLGIFSGNRDSETEVANKLRLPNNNKDGVVCRYIRIYPLNHGEGGYHGRKSMRIGVYGNDKYEDKNVKNKKEEEGEEGKESVSNNGNCDGIKNANIPAAIITIKQPSNTNNRNCWAVNKMNNGVFSCSCSMCSRKRPYRVLRKDQRNCFKKQIKKLKHVNDYNLDYDWIGYHSFRKRSVW